MKTTFLLTALLLVAPAHAGQRSSSDYSVWVEATDAGGKRTTSVRYTNDGSVGVVGGMVGAVAPQMTVKSGYAGQLFEVTALQITASAATVNELGTLQLAASQLLDDLTSIAVSSASIAWSVPGGPLTGIAVNGVATAGAVYADTSATVQGSFAGLSGTLNLTVLDSIPDNFGSYAGDGIGDDWQQQHFGLDNPNAAPGLDPDGDGHTNLFEYIAALDPVSSVSRFLLNSSRVAGQPGQMKIVFSPVVPGLTYTVKSSTSPGAGAIWEALTSFSTTNEGNTRMVTDLDAGGTRKFYRVEITFP